MKFASQYGLAEVTIGNMAKRCSLSRTGLISHFENKEDMQMAILDYCEAQFFEHVVEPARDPDPLVQLKKLFTIWAEWTQEKYNEAHMSCPFVKALVEFNCHLESPIREKVTEQHNRLFAYIKHKISLCIEAKQLTRDIDPQDLAYHLYSLYLGHAVAKNTVLSDNASDIFTRQITHILNSYQTANTSD
ncbi:TetR/AcrR family transcriptional regulator (plasmid) [Pseudoalteromonas sp. T1lg65]|uniref:TetR/AcrR family transcriptional regulator n=1 Tax=Pseudoalteromonas sp. T1lg65 TaxID=2077101 RepID=UPI003F7AABBD